MKHALRELGSTVAVIVLPPSIPLPRWARSTVSDEELADVMRGMQR